MLSPEHLPMSWEHIKLLKQSMSWCFFQPGFGGLDPRLVLRIGGSHFALEEVGERAMKLPSSSPKIPPPVLTTWHGDSRSSQAALCQQQANWDYYLLALTCQGSYLTQALIIIIIYFSSDVLRAWSRAVFLWEARGALQDVWCWGSGRRHKGLKGWWPSHSAGAPPVLPRKNVRAGTSLWVLELHQHHLHP